MRKVILTTVAVAIAGAVAFKPAPASAVAIFLPFVLVAKEDKNFKAVNPYAPVKAKAKKAKRKR